MASSPAIRHRVISQLTQGRRQGQSDFAASPSPRIYFEEELTGTVSSFAPEHESTQQFDTATQDQFLPGQMHIPGEMPTYSDSMSIEIGRGVKRSARNSPKPYAMEEDISENPILSLGNNSLYELTGTPPLKSTTSRKTNDAQYSLRKQASARRAATLPQPDITKTSDIIPNKSCPAVTSGRRTLSDVHAKVNAESESFMLEDFRPRKNTVQKEKASRFSRPRVSSGMENIPTRFAAGAGLARDTEQTPRRVASSPDPAFSGNQTAQSFMLPNLPDITELVSGVRKDGTPVFSKTQKAKSRFTSGSYARGGSDNTTQYAPLHSIPLPDEEKAIFASLQLLQDKVAQLEMEKSESTKRIEEYANEVIGLRAQVQAERGLRRPDSALGSEDEENTKEKWRIEKSNLKAAVKAASDRLERAERKQSVSDIAVKRMTSERDNLVTQLGVAFYSNEELKDENADLLKQNDVSRQSNKELREALGLLKRSYQGLQAEIAQQQAEHEEEKSQWQERETEFNARIEQQEENLKDMTKVTREIWEGRKSSFATSEKADAPSEKIQRRRSSGRALSSERRTIIDRVEEEIRRTRAAAATGDQAPIATKSESARRSGSRSKTTPADKPQEQKIEVAPVTKPTAYNDESEDITYLSYLDPLEISKLRKKLEDEHRAARVAKTNGATSASRKSSLKDLTSRLDNVSRAEDTQAGEVTGTLRNVRIQSPNTSDQISYSEPDFTTDASVMSTGSRRPRSAIFEEMTSGFILPDITLGQQVKASASEHKSDSCTFCPAENLSKKIDIPMPVPVTERDFDITNMDDTAMTVRPSQPPAIALATVLKQLEDEVAHLKLKFTAYNRVYASHEPALGRRKRRALKAKIDELLIEIERRSEQIYSLYDVLEGHKQVPSTATNEPAPMAEEEVEETLQSLGIDTVELKERMARVMNKADRATGKAQSITGPRTGIPALDELLDESDEELPWEGLSDGSDVESVDFTAQRRRSVAA